MISISEALKIIENQVGKLKAETIDLVEAVGRVLAETVKADMDLPPFNRSQMDGFALKSKDTKDAPVNLKIIGESVAGKGFDGRMKSGESVRIMTGARLPEGADAVQKVELTEENDGFAEITEAAKSGQHINLLASEIKSGTKIFGAGEIINEQMIAAIASFGYAKIKVFKRPKIAILSTGTEIVGISEMPQKDQIRNSNSIMLKIFAGKYGDSKSLPTVKDDVESLTAAIENALENYDVLVTTGGVSVGDYDFTKTVLRDLGAEIFFEKISLKPGKPTVFAKRNNCLVFGLPGNPVSSAVTFYLFARTAILRMQSANNCELRKGFAIVASKIKAAKERDSVLPALVATNAKGELIIESLRFNGSSNFIAFARANALVFVPQGKSLEIGDVAEIMFLP
ncbi:MAG: molybdopterin molybdotransferase MoeA [Pyrinomonadaceae bacterium]|nr:molybdopterin molybdotransferase MoeA [Pyrinomonadaceae bacterium]